MSARIRLDECGHKWRQTASDLREIQDRISSLTTKLLLSSVENTLLPQEADAMLRLLQSLNEADVALNGLSYLCTPQPEWTGGDGTVIRAPHIVNSK